MDEDRSLPPGDVDAAWLGAWLDAGMISAERFHEEMRRRQAATDAQVTAPSAGAS